MTLNQLGEEINKLINQGWGGCAVYAISNNGGKLDDLVVGVSTVDPPVPKPAPFICILVDD